MPDIKLTLDHKKLIVHEDAHMQQEGSLLYPLNKQPREAVPGAWVYFILRDQLVSRATIVEFTRFTDAEVIAILDYAGNDIWQPGWWVRCAGMQVLADPVASAGFQGFRYLTDEEIQAFPQAFA